MCVCVCVCATLNFSFSCTLVSINLTGNHNKQHIDISRMHNVSSMHTWRRKNKICIHSSSKHSRFLTPSTLLRYYWLSILFICVSTWLYENCFWNWYVLAAATPEAPLLEQAREEKYVEWGREKIAYTNTLSCNEERAPSLSLAHAKFSVKDSGNRVDYTSSETRRRVKKVQKAAGKWRARVIINKVIMMQSMEEINIYQ